MLKFEWNRSKESRNRKKHGVSFQEAQSVFFSEQALQFFDDGHAELEDRFVMLGLSNRLRMLVVIHCESCEGEVIRIISARKATAQERQFYSGRYQ